MVQISLSMGAGLDGSSRGKRDLPSLLYNLDALVLDMDGVLYEGYQALPGARELIELLNLKRTPYVLFSNNTTYSLGSHMARLSQLGMDVPSGAVVTAAWVAAQTLAVESEPGSRCLIIGERGLVEAFEQAGFDVTQTDSRAIRYVVVGMDRQLTYAKLKVAVQALRSGAELVSSNPDPVYPDGQEIIPASGAIQAALEAAAGVRARVTGKPALPGFELALGLLGTEPQRTGMLGDQLATDMLGAVRAGMKAFLVLSSITPEFQADRAPVQPDWIFSSTLDFYQEWVKRGGRTNDII